MLLTPTLFKSQLYYILGKKERERKATDREKIAVDHIPNKGLIWRLYKHSQNSTVNTKKSNLENGQNT